MVEVAVDYDADSSDDDQPFRLIVITLFTPLEERWADSMTRCLTLPLKVEFISFLLSFRRR